MNYVEIAIWAITGLALGLGLILGIVRGAKRSVLRLVLVVLCVLGAYLAREWLTNIVLEIKIGEVNVQEFLINLLGPDFAELGTTVIIMISVLASVLVFIISFYLLKLVTWLIVFPLCKLFVKKDKKKHPLFGALIGLVQGAIVALCICIPLSGLVVQTNKLMASVNDAQDAMASAPAGDEYYAYDDEGNAQFPDGDEMTEPDEEEKGDVVPGEGTGSEKPEGEGNEGNQGEEPQQPGEGEGEGNEGGESAGGLIPQQYLDMMTKYQESFLGKFYTQTLHKPFEWISTIKVETTDEETGEKTTKKYSLEGQVDAVVGAIKMAKEFAALKDIDWSVDFNGNIAEQIKSILDKVEETKSTLSQEAIDTINEVAGSLLGKVIPGDMGDFKFDVGKINFSKEGKLIVEVVEIANKEDFTAEDFKDLAQAIADSDLVMPMLENVNGSLPVTESQQETIRQALDDLEADETMDIDLEVLNTLRGLFGLNKSAAE